MHDPKRFKVANRKVKVGLVQMTCSKDPVENLDKAVAKVRVHTSAPVVIYEPTERQEFEGFKRTQMILLKTRSVLSVSPCR